MLSYCISSILSNVSLSFLILCYLTLMELFYFIFLSYLNGVLILSYLNGVLFLSYLSLQARTRIGTYLLEALILFISLLLEDDAAGFYVKAIDNCGYDARKVMRL